MVPISCFFLQLPAVPISCFPPYVLKFTRLRWQDKKIILTKIAMRSRGISWAYFYLLLIWRLASDICIHNSKSYWFCWSTDQQIAHLLTCCHLASLGRPGIPHEAASAAVVGDRSPDPEPEPPRFSSAHISSKNRPFSATSEPEPSPIRLFG